MAILLNLVKCFVSSEETFTGSLTERREFRYTRMSSQVTCGSNRVAKTLASRLRLTNRSPLPCPLPVTPFVLRLRVVVCTATGYTLGFCFGERRTTVVHFGTLTSGRVGGDGVETAASTGHCDPSSGPGVESGAREIA